MFFRDYPCMLEGEGEDWECLYETEETHGDNDDCTECVALWKKYGGRRSPKNWRSKWPWIVCFLLWGPPYTQLPWCKNCSFYKKNFCTKKHKTINKPEYCCNEYIYKKSKTIYLDIESYFG